MFVGGESWALREGYLQRPLQVKFLVHDTFACSKRVFLKFARNRRCRRSPKRRQRMADETEACGTTRMEARSQRYHVGGQAKVAASMYARGSTSLECQKVTL
jgi:hypothetical protein